jgi:hypothetical protein
MVARVELKVIFNHLCIESAMLEKLHMIRPRPNSSPKERKLDVGELLI